MWNINTNLKRSIIESVRSICRDSADIQYTIIHKNLSKSISKTKILSIYVYTNITSMFEFFLRPTRPVVAQKSIVNVPNQKAAKCSKCFSSFFFFLLPLDGLAKYCVNLSQWFIMHKTAVFKLLPMDLKFCNCYKSAKISTTNLKV